MAKSPCPLDSEHPPSWVGLPGCHRVRKDKESLASRDITSVNLLCTLLLKVLYNIGSTGRDNPIKSFASFYALLSPHSSPGKYSLVKQQKNVKGALPQHLSFLYPTTHLNSFSCVTPISFPTEEFLTKTRISHLPTTKIS